MLVLSLATAGVAAAATTPEFKPVPTKHKFKGTSGPSIGGQGSEVYRCSKGTVTGEISGGQKLVNTVVAFTGCTSSGAYKSGCPVHTYGAKSGEIVSESLNGELGTVAAKEAPSGVGVLLKEVGEDGWWEMEGNECTRGAFWEGSVAAEVAVIGKKQATNKLVIRPELKKITLDSGLPETAELRAFATPMKWENTFEVTFEEPLEVT
jgi:hypothetical protein